MFGRFTRTIAFCKDTASPAVPSSASIPNPRLSAARMPRSAGHQVAFLAAPFGHARRRREPCLPPAIMRLARTMA